MPITEIRELRLYYRGNCPPKFASRNDVVIAAAKASEIRGNASSRPPLRPRNQRSREMVD